jgi:hypothetical protein
MSVEFGSLLFCCLIKSGDKGNNEKKPMRSIFEFDGIKEGR